MELRSPSFDSVVGSPRTASVVVQNNHALVSSASAAGKAKSMLPVVSTLIFGLAANLAPTTAQPMSFFFAVCARVEFTLQARPRLLDGVEAATQVSAACSLYTTTYAVLEAYYIAMVTSGDVTARYLHLADEEWGRNTCDSLARKVDDMLRAFEPYRRRSLDAVWGGVVFLLIAYCCGCAPPLRRADRDRWGMWFSIPPLAAGVVFVPRTVLMFRRAFVPLVERYRTLDGADAAEPIRTCGDYITSRRGGSPR